MTALHCPAVRHTSELAQSASVAAMQVSPSREHFPANAHCWDFLHSLSDVAMQAPSFTWQLPLVAQAPRKEQSVQGPYGIWQSASDAATHAPSPKWQSPDRPHGISLLAQPSSVSTHLPSM